MTVKIAERAFSWDGSLRRRATTSRAWRSCPQWITEHFMEHVPHAQELFAEWQTAR